MNFIRVLSIYMDIYYLNIIYYSIKNKIIYTHMDKNYKNYMCFIIYAYIILYFKNYKCYKNTHMYVI